jgi:3-hydroxyisobutyrate dehydrogenase-like beta-hydroxyacid dehydrogenase
MLPDDDAVQQVVEGPDGVLEGAKPGHLLIALATARQRGMSLPATARTIRRSSRTSRSSRSTGSEAAERR